MNTVIEARHMEVTNSLREYIESKAEKLPKFFDSVHSIEITLDIEADMPLTEIIARAGRKSTFVASVRDQDMYACVDQCMHKIAEQLRRHKDRVRDHHAPARNTLSESTDLQ